MAAFDEFLRFIYATIARFIPKKNVYRNMCTRSREREREEADEGCVKICKRVQRPLGASGAVWITIPPHILLFLVSGGGENSFDAYKARLKSESTKKRKEEEKNIASILSLKLCDTTRSFFFPFPFCPGWGETRL